jgi:hypothetical protein
MINDTFQIGSELYIAYSKRTPGTHPLRGQSGLREWRTVEGVKHEAAEGQRAP